MQRLGCFKAYDIRGQLGTELDEDVAYRIGRAYAAFLKPRQVVIGGDMRLSTESLKQALAKGLCDAGVDVVDIGLCGTEEIYFATAHLQMDGGIMVTASHNPKDYNGMKLVRENSKPISGDTGLNEIEVLVRGNDFSTVNESERGDYQKASTLDAYIEHLLGYITPSAIKPLKLVVNAGNGVAGHCIDALEQRFSSLEIPITFIKVHHQPDGTFPNGIPNPILEENRADTIRAVIDNGADFGIAWDGDFDRCFLFDEQGRFIEGYYIVGLLAEAFLDKHPGSKIIHDPRLTWNTLDIAAQKGGKAIQSKTGHAFIKERMRVEDAIYGGEMSAHHYFRDFFYCDSGMIPWLLVAELVSRKAVPLSALVDERIARYPSPGEINRKLKDPQAAIANVLKRYETDAISVDHTDGISVEMADWRFNLRSSNTEPVVRLNIETRGDVSLMRKKTDEILALLV
ncbi:phosphomannomutase CpsG [Sedimenticola selenatireducens]|uniref:phosphomannomutase n=1 Tax=Sedimenticola selenatireducens TaxID=191960 RepID=A0A557RRB6_9GAMM|nr:phosphomannomutase CpsG [Sedimenticola selenatireducens]TVO67718.1 phosphomannomutase CpsG [Sedimenticola selenatireducens]TVT61796.1 MAG: phosphomannomutase CpsG [Sedimenticola selenatireducens]